MCEPVSLTVAALSVLSAGANIHGTREAAKTQFAANAAQREAQQEEILASASVQAGERVKQARAERARIRVSAGEANVAGNSFMAMLSDSVLQEDMDIGTIGLDARFQDRASEARFMSANAAVNNPSLFQNITKLGMAAVSGYSMGQSLLIPTSTIPGGVPMAGGTELTLPPLA